MRWLSILLIIVLTVLGLSGLTEHRDEAAPEPVPAHPAEIVVNEQTGVSTTWISVLTYNIRGLPWPVASGRSEALKDIAAELRRLQEIGEAPDVLLVQEAFTKEARRIGALAGYPYHASGPEAGDRASFDLPPLDPEFLAGRRVLRGEAFGKILSSGLTVHSRYPIRMLGTTPFGRNSCAGYDCLANKGVMLVAVEMPGVPEPVQIMNTPMNSNKASGVSEEQSLIAHQRQIDEIRELIERDARGHWPLIFGGDFNVRRSDERYAHTDRRMPGSIVHHHCSAIASDCDVRLSWGGNEPWMETQDHQGFANGARVRVRPMRVEAMFDTPHDGRVLSDHDGLLVSYELSWSRSDAVVTPEAGDSREDGSAESSQDERPRSPVFYRPSDPKDPRERL